MNGKAAAFSLDGKKVVTVLYNHTTQLWDAQTGKLLGPLFKNRAKADDVAFSQNGKLAVTRLDDKTMQVLDAESGQPVGQPMVLDHGVVDDFFTPDSKWVVTSGEGLDAVRFWDAQTGQPVSFPIEDSNGVDFASFSPDSQQVLLISRDGAQLWHTTISGPQAPPWLAELAEVVGGKHLNSQGALEPSILDPAQLRQQLQKLSGNDDLSRFGRWIAANPSTRAVDPFSTITVPEFVAARLKENTADSIQEAYDADPDNPLVLAALAKLTFDTDEDEARFYFQVALRYARLAKAPEQIGQVLAMARADFPDGVEFSGVVDSAMQGQSSANAAKP